MSRCNCTPPYSGENGISARSDLNPADGKYPISALGHRKSGGTDAKVRLALLLSYVFSIDRRGLKQPREKPSDWDSEETKLTDFPIVLTNQI